MAQHVVVVEYRVEWKEMFSAEAEKIREILGDNCTAVYHIGSTSVPGLKAKPIIDIMPVVKELGKVDELTPAFEAIGYERMGEFGIPGRRYFRKGEDERTHQIHIFEENNRKEIERHLAVRDYLRTHEEAAVQYGELKSRLAAQFPFQIEEYCDGKDEFVKELERKALWWKETQKRMKKKYLFFDLDGTLTDPAVGITKSVEYALAAFGISVEDRKVLEPFIGPPLRDSFVEYYHFTEDQAGEAIIKYREYFGVNGWKENEVYPGIKEMLRDLKEAGYTLMVATSKPEIFANRILDHFGLAEYFSFVGGANLDETRVKKGEVIRFVLEENHISDREEVLMVGDRKHDCIGARENGIDCVGVLYGYGSREELEAEKPYHLAETVEELRDFLLHS